jgi:hypothetical protein
MSRLLLILSMMVSLVHMDVDSKGLDVSIYQQHFIRCIQEVLKRYAPPGRTVHISPVGDKTGDGRTENRRQNLRVSPLEWNDFFMDAVTKEIHSASLWPLRVYGTRLSIGWRCVNHHVGPEDVYIILIQKSSSTVNTSFLVEDIRNLILQKAWNSRARFVVVLPLLTSPQFILRMCRVLWLQQVLNFVILALENRTELSIGTYTWFPFRSHHFCADIQEYAQLDRWLIEGEGRFVFNFNLFPPKIPNDILGCPLRASTYSNEPYVTISEQTETESHAFQKHYSGLEVKLLREVAEGMNATLVFRDAAPRNDSMWGTRLGNGTVTGIVGDVIYGRSHVAFSAMPKGFDMLEDILESTISYIDSSLVWYVPCAGRRESWTSVIRMYSVSLWLLVVTVYVIVAFITWKLAEYSKRLLLGESRLYSNVMEAFCTVFSIVVGCTAAELPRTTSVRCIILVWLWYSFAFNVIFQTFYTSFLVHPGMLKQIKNVDDLLDSEIKVSYIRELDYLYRDGSDAEDKKILQRRTYCDDVARCLDQTAIQGDTATIANNLDVYYRSKNAHLLCRLEEDIFRFNIAMFMAKGSPLLDRVDSVILRFLEGGLLRQWMKEHKEYLQKGEPRRGMTNQGEEEVVYFVFTVSHLSVVFGCLIVGYILSFVVFICELIYRWFLNKHHSRVLRETNVILFRQTQSSRSRETLNFSSRSR